MYEPHSNAYRVLLGTGKISISKDVIFDETSPAASTQERSKHEEEEEQPNSAANTEVIQADTEGIDHGPTYSTDSHDEEEAPQETQPTTAQPAAKVYHRSFKSRARAVTLPFKAAQGTHSDLQSSSS